MHEAPAEGQLRVADLRCGGLPQEQRAAEDAEGQRPGGEAGRDGKRDSALQEPIGSGGSSVRSRGGVAGKRVQVEGEVVGRVEALLGVLLEAMPHDALEAGRDAAVGLGEVGRLLRQDGAHRVRGRLAVEGALAREHLVEDRTEGKDVAARVGGTAAHLLGRHVAERAENDSGLGSLRRGRQVRLLASETLGLRELGEAEVQDLDAAVLGDEEVLGLQISMDDPLLVRRSEAVGDLDRVVDRLALGQSASGKPRAQRLALEQLRDDIGLALEGADVVDRQDVGVVQGPGRLRLLLEAAQPLRIARERRRQHLDRDVPLESLVARPVHLAHSSGANLAEDLVGAELRSG